MSTTQPTPQAGAVPVGHQGARVDIEERKAQSLNGWLGVLVLFICVGAAIAIHDSRPSGLIAVPIVVFVIVIGSLVIVPPGQTVVVQFFGRYVGTLRQQGLSWVLPLATRRRVSVRVRNFETSHLKVNDADGNPVEIAAIVVWQVADTSKATFAVDSYLDFITVQAESALRHVATSHPYDNSSEGYVPRPLDIDYAAGAVLPAAQRLRNGSARVLAGQHNVWP